MTAITMRFDGLYEKILNQITRSGLATSKSEAIRLALFKMAVDYGFINQETLLKMIRAENKKHPLSEEEIMEGIENAKRATVHR